MLLDHHIGAHSAIIQGTDGSRIIYIALYYYAVLEEVVRVIWGTTTTSQFRPPFGRRLLRSALCGVFIMHDSGIWTMKRYGDGERGGRASKFIFKPQFLVTIFEQIVVRRWKCGLGLTSSPRVVLAATKLSVAKDRTIRAIGKCVCMCVCKVCVVTSEGWIYMWPSFDVIVFLWFYALDVW